MAEGQNGQTLVDGRYRTLLEVSSAIAQQPNLQAILTSLHRLLSAVVPFESVAILLLAEDGQSVRVTAVEADSPGGNVHVGTEFAHMGTLVERVMNERQPIYIPDMPAELGHMAPLASLGETTHTRSGYLFPLSTPRRALGALSVGSAKEGEFSEDDISLMGSVASHVATAIESAIAIDTADSYQKQLLHQRDRLRLLLEVNNHIIAQLNVNDLLRAASSSIRNHFANDFAGFWILDKEKRKLECAVVDFPESTGPIAHWVMPELTDEEVEKIRTRQADLW